MGGAAAGGFAQFLGSAMQADAADAATRAQADAARNAQNQQWSMYQQQRADASPWRNTGGAAVQQLGWLMGLPSGGNYAGDSGNPQGNSNGWVDKNGNIAYASDLNPSVQRALQSGGGVGSFGSPQLAMWLAANGHAVPNDKLQDGSYLMDQYNQVMKSRGYSQIGGGQGAGMASGFQGNPNDFGALNRRFSMADFQADPGYDFRMREGMKALERSGSARGMSLSGAQFKGLDRYSQDFASNEYGNAYNRFNNDQSQRYNRLANLAGLGQTANGQLMQGGMNAANNMSNASMAAGNAAAAGAVANGNIWGNFANNMGNAMSQWGAMNWGNKGTSGTGMAGSDIRDQENGSWWD